MLFSCMNFSSPVQMWQGTEYWPQSIFHRTLLGLAKNTFHSPVTVPGLLQKVNDRFGFQNIFHWQ